jgi:macrodomain Ter protein organizer (MatP/YcbG family)
MFLKPPAPIVEAEAITAPAPAEEAVTPAIVNKIDDIAPEAAPAMKVKKARKAKEEIASPRTIYLTDSVFQRLQLMAIMQKKRISSVISKLLDEAAEDLIIKKAS